MVIKIFYQIFSPSAQPNIFAIVRKPSRHLFWNIQTMHNFRAISYTFEIS
jgi:hypothetical protein